MKYSLCLEPIFENVDFYDRFAIAKELGLDAVEFWEPEKFNGQKIGSLSSMYDIPVAGCCIYDTRNVTMNSEWDKLKPNILKTIEFGKETGCKKFIGLSGNVTCKADNQKMIITENLKRSSEICEKEGITLLLEPLNSALDHAGCYLDSSYIGFEIIKTVNSPSVKLLYDIYHMQIMEGNIVANITHNINLIGHIHSAGVPGRHELQLGEINYPFVIEQIEKAGYDGYIGFEYFPTYENRKSVSDILKYVKG